MQMRRTRPAKPKITVLCEVCTVVPVTSGKVCTGCRVRKCRGADVDGRACAVPSCRIALARVLRLIPFGDELVPLCANHAALAGRRGLTLDEFLAEAAEREAELTPIPASVRQAG
jgi:hypothetical protein